MAVTAAFSLYSTTVPAGAPFDGNVLLTNGSTAVGLAGIEIHPPNKNTRVEVGPPVVPDGSNGTVGGGANPPDVLVPTSGTLVIPFKGIGAGGTWTAVAYLADGTQATASVSVTAV